MLKEQPVIKFLEDKEPEILGTLKFSNGKFYFDGDADVSAKKFIEFVQANWDSKLKETETKLEKAVDTIELAFKLPEKDFRITIKAVLQTLKEK